MQPKRQGITHLVVSEAATWVGWNDSQPCTAKSTTRFYSYTVGVREIKVGGARVCSVGECAGQGGVDGFGQKLLTLAWCVAEHAGVTHLCAK